MGFFTLKFEGIEGYYFSELKMYTSFKHIELLVFPFIYLVTLGQEVSIFSKLVSAMNIRLFGKKLHSNIQIAYKESKR